MPRWPASTRWSLLLALLGAACHKEATTAPGPDGCLGARCVEEAEAAIWEGEDAKAREPLTILCDKRDGFQCFRLAELHEKGRGGPVDLDQAAHYYEESCKLEHADGCERRYRLAAEGKGGPEVELEYALKGCDLGVRLACTYAGDLLHQGRGVSQDNRRAALAYEKGCGLGDPEGCIRAGDLLFDPKGPWEQQARSLAAYLSACTGYNSRGCVRSGVAFYDGVGVNRSEERAAAQFAKACDMSDDDGCHLAKQIAAAKGQRIALDLTTTADALESFGLEARDLACRLPEQGTPALAKILAALAANVDKLDACAPAGAALGVDLTLAKGRVTDVRLRDKLDKKTAECVTAALRRAKPPLDGACKLVVLLGDDAAAAQAYEARPKGVAAVAAEAAAQSAPPPTRGRR